MTQTEERPLLLDDDLWERIVDLTGGAANVCYQCGACTAVCPWSEVRDEPLNVRQLLRRAQLGIESTSNGANDIWLCTGCRQCIELCPRDVDVPALFKSLRSVAWQDREVPEGLSSVLWSMHWDGNPWGQPPSQRFEWAQGLNLEPYSAEQHEVLLYIGCSASYDARLQRVARALVTVLRAAEVRFGVLSEGEPCCGEAALALGNLEYASEIVEATQQFFRDAGVRKVVTISPHCLDMFRSHYTVGEDFEPLHYTELLSQLVADGRLNLGSVEPGVFTYQDPCFLGRAYSVYEQPRTVLNAIGGVELREMDDNREQGLCCGGGGGRMWVDTPAKERFAGTRIRQAQATGADVLVTACPSCLSCLEDGVTLAGARDVRVMDVAEVAAAALAGTSRTEDAT